MVLYDLHVTWVYPSLMHLFLVVTRFATASISFKNTPDPILHARAEYLRRALAPPVDPHVFYSNIGLQSRQDSSSASIKNWEWLLVCRHHCMFLSKSITTKYLMQDSLRYHANAGWFFFTMSNRCEPKWSAIRFSHVRIGLPIPTRMFLFSFILFSACDIFWCEEQ